MLYIFTKISFKTEETPDETVSRNYFRKLLSFHPFFTVSLPSSDNLVHFLGHTAIMNPFKFSNLSDWSSNISSEHCFHGWECFRRRTKQKLNIKVVQRTRTDIQEGEED